MSLKDKIQELKNEMAKENVIPENGLGDELFLFSSTLTPVVNVDLLVYNHKHEILLCWRDDSHCGCGWHVPGGCLRFRETLENRVQKTAIKELGTQVIINSEPIKIFEIFSPEYRKGLMDQRERAHFITLVYACQLKEEIKQINSPRTPGYLKWFEQLPNNLLQVQQCYKDSWQEIEKKLWRK